MTMNSRRYIFRVLIPSIFIGASDLGISLQAKADALVAGDDLFDLLKPEDDPEFGHIIRNTSQIGGAAVGTGLSRHDEVRTGFKLLFNAPRNVDVLTTARYFALLRDKNTDGELYSWEWSKRSNPLITGFFAMTGTSPAEGDQTSWCAAFVSFCLYLANKPNPFTALSGGYRGYSVDSTGNPRPGDVVVFSKRGLQGQQGFGHVGFFLSSETRENREGVMLLGGNQRGSTGSTGAVTEAWFPLEGKDLYLHSIRRVS